jgi:asparagine synthase (glutamine-hydrolysing)
MRASLEMRTPFLDRSVAQFAAEIPGRVHTRGGGKVLLRQLLRRVLPDLRVGSTKTAFRTPTAEWLRGPLATALREQVAGSRLYDEEWFDRAAVARLVDEHAGQAHDHSAVLWPTFVLGCWLDAQGSSIGV